MEKTTAVPGVDVAIKPETKEFHYSPRTALSLADSLLFIICVSCGRRVVTEGRAPYAIPVWSPICLRGIRTCDECAILANVPPLAVGY